MLTAHDFSLPGCRLFESTDVEETRDRISAVMQPHDLQPLGRDGGARAYMDFVDIAGLGIGAIGFGRMRVTLNRVEDYHLVILCRRGTATLRSAGEEWMLDARHGVCLAPGAPLDAEFSVDCEQFVLRIGKGLFRRHTGQANPDMYAAIDLERPEWQSWAKVLWSLSGNPDLARENPTIAVDYQRLLLGLLLKAGARPRSEARSAAPYSVKRAEAFIRENSARDLCLEDIARAAETPARTLLGSFRRFRQTTPMSYLRDVRLDRVRMRLGAARPEETVTTIALEEGFGHLGRFAQDYTARFGERPSETLKALRPR